MEKRMGKLMGRYLKTWVGTALLVAVGSTYAFLDDGPVPAKPKPAKQSADESRNKPHNARDEAARGLLWADSDNGATVNWNEAKKYCASKGSGWRLPTVAELRSSYQSGHLTQCGQDTCKVSSNSRLTGAYFWSNEPSGSSGAWGSDLYVGDHGLRSSNAADDGNIRRALCVRRP